MQTQLDTLFETRVNVTQFYSQCVAGKFQFLGKPFSISDLFLFLKLMIAQHQISVWSHQLVQALVKMRGELFYFRGLGIRRRYIRRKFRFEALQEDFFGYSIKIKCRIAYIIFQKPVNLGYHDVDRLISQVVRLTAAAAAKDAYQATPDFLISFAGFVTVRIEPAQQLLESFLSWPSCSHLSGILDVSCRLLNTCGNIPQ